VGAITGGGTDFYISNMMINAVPEPTTAALLGGVGASLLVRRRRDE
jgi:hypothetical protein